MEGGVEEGGGREWGRGGGRYMMHQVLPEKEVSPLGSASWVSLLETGREEKRRAASDD